MCTKGDFVEFDLTNTARKKNEDGIIKRRNMKSRLESKKVVYKDYDITLIRSNRKSIAIEINRDLQIKVRAPQTYDAESNHEVCHRERRLDTASSGEDGAVTSKAGTG